MDAASKSSTSLAEMVIKEDDQVDDDDQGG